MAGFAVLFEPGSTQQSREDDFHSLLEDTAYFKELNQPPSAASGAYCTAAKLDAPASLHKGIVKDDKSGSWLLAAGTIVALKGNNDPSALLERLLIDYLENEGEALERYDGHFALVIYNGRENSLSVVSDPMGLFAFYYASRGKQMFVSSSAFAVARAVRAKPDELMMESFLRTGRPHGEKTLWKDVKRVRPATNIKVTSTGIQEKEYWIPQVDKNINQLPIGEALTLAEEKICRLFDLQMKREGKVWADLTGGFDSRLTTLFLEKVGIQFTAYCVGPEDHPDVIVSKLVAKEMGWDYQHMPVPTKGEQEYAPWLQTALHKGDGSLNVVELAGVLEGHKKQSTKSFAHISGGGADEWRYHAYGTRIMFPRKRIAVNYDEMLNTWIFDHIPLQTLRQDRTEEVIRELKSHLSAIADTHAAFDLDNAILTDVIFRRHRHPLHGGAYLSAESGIMRALLPFCLKELEVFGLSIPHKWKFKYQFSFIRHLLEKENAKLASIRTVIGGPAIPIRVTNIYKFAPMLTAFTAKSMRKTIKKVVRKAPGNTFASGGTNGNPRQERVDMLRWAISERLFDPSNMCTGQLFDPRGLSDYVNRELSGLAVNSEFLDRVITIEMAMRAANTPLI